MDEEEVTFMNKYNSEKIQAWTDNYINYVLLRNEIITIKDNQNNQKENSPSLIDETQNTIEIQNINSNNKNINDNNNENNENNENIIKIKSRKTDSSVSLLSEKSNDLSMSSEEISININMNKGPQIQKEKTLKNQIKNLKSLINKEINKMYKFYTTKEKDLVQGINLQIDRAKNIIKKINNLNEKELLSIIDSLKDISNLCKELINYVYLNMEVLKRILNLFDTQLNNVTQTTSYIKYLFKQNKDLLYILTFKILDETCLAVENLFHDLKKKVKSHKIFEDPSNEKNKTDFKNSKKNILDNTSQTNIIHDKIFSNLTEWQNYLNVSLNLPSYTSNPIFKNTTIIGESIPKENKKKNKKYDKNIKKNKNDKINDDFKKTVTKNKESEIENTIIIARDSIIENDEKENEKEDENEEKEEILLFKSEDELFDEDLEEDEYTRQIGRISCVGSNLFEPSYRYSSSTENFSFPNNKKNLIFLFCLIGFYSYSYSIIIPKIIILIYNNKNLNEIFYYGLAISIPLLGNLFSQIYMPKIYQEKYKYALILSLLLILIYYILYIIGIKETNIFFIIIGRFFFGLSYLKQLSKAYIDNYVPLTNQIQSNRYYVFWANVGFSFGFFINIINIDDNIILFDIINGNNLIIFISGIILLIILVLVIIFFKEPIKESFNEFDDKFNENDRLSNEFIMNNEKKLISELNENENKKLNIRTITKLSKVSGLNSYIYYIENTKKFYFIKLYFILLILLIANQYASENLLLLIPRICYFKLGGKENYLNYYEYLIVISIISLIFFINYFIQAKCVEKNCIKTKGRCLLMTLSLLILLFHFFFGFVILPGCFPNINDASSISKNKLYKIYFPIVGIILLIIFTELFHVATVNMFIELLPSQDLKFCCFKMSTLITIITKLARIIPFCIIILIESFDENIENFLLGVNFAVGNNAKKYNLCNLVLFGLQSLNYIICFIVCLVSSKLLKKGFKNRILATR